MDLFQEFSQCGQRQTLLELEVVISEQLSQVARARKAARPHRAPARCRDRDRALPDALSQRTGIRVPHEHQSKLVIALHIRNRDCRRGRRRVQRVVRLVPVPAAASGVQPDAGINPLNPRNHVGRPALGRLCRLDALPVETRDCLDRPLRVHGLLVRVLPVRFSVVLLLLLVEFLLRCHDVGLLTALLLHARVPAVRALQRRRRRKLRRRLGIQHTHLQRLLLLLLPVLHQLLARECRRIHLHQPLWRNFPREHVQPQLLVPSQVKLQRPRLLLIPLRHLAPVRLIQRPLHRLGHLDRIPPFP